MFYTIRFRDCHGFYFIVCTRECLFNVVLALNESERVIEFTVSDVDELLLPKKDFNWGPIEKWVSGFVYKAKSDLERDAEMKVM